MQIRKRLGGFLLGLVLAAGTAQAQQPLRIVVPFAAGGGTDQYARLLASELTSRGTQTIVENKPGASGIVAADNVARSKPDGTTLLMSSLSILASNTVMYDKLPYDPVTSFTPVRPRRTRSLRKLDQNGSASEGPMCRPTISRLPSVLTATAIIAATLTIRPPSRTLR